MSANCNVIIIFFIYGQFEAIKKPGSRRMVCKTYTFIDNSLSLKTEKLSFSTIALSKGTIFAKKC